MDIYFENNSHQFQSVQLLVRICIKNAPTDYIYVPQISISALLQTFPPNRCRYSAILYKDTFAQVLGHDYQKVFEKDTIILFHFYALQTQNPSMFFQYSDTRVDSHQLTITTTVVLLIQHLKFLAPFIYL